MSGKRNRQLTLIASALLLLLAAGALANAAEPTPAQETLARRAGLKAAAKIGIRSTPTDQIAVKSLENGMLKVSVPLPHDEAFLARLAQEGPIVSEVPAKPFLLALTVDLFEPDLVGDTVSYDCAPLEDADYYYGWVVVNLSSSDRELKSTAIVKGPGGRIKATGRLTYDAGAMVLYVFIGDAVIDPGIYTYSVKVTSAGSKLKARFCAGC